MNSVTTIPGTDVPFKIYERKGPPSVKTSAEVRQRRGLLAKIHIAKAEMGLNDGEYDMILKSFKVASSADMTIPQLEKMVKLLKHYGWKPRKLYGAKKDVTEQVAALKERVRVITLEIPNGDIRLPGLIKKICGVDTLAWSNNVKKLERLLAALSKIKEMADERLK